MWRSVGFLMSFAVVLQGISVVTYIVILSGGKRLRENGWGLLSLLIVLSALLQAASMSIVVGSPHAGCGVVLTPCARHTSMITKTGSSSAGISMIRGSFVPLAGAWVSSALARSLSRRKFCPRREGMSLFRIMMNLECLRDSFGSRIAALCGCLNLFCFARGLRYKESA
jgi:hypothetical protein